MKVFLKVAVDIATKEGQTVSDDDLASAVEEAVNNALHRARDEGWDCEIRDRVVILPDYVEVMDTDNV